MPKLSIDGKEIEAAAGKSVIQVALENGIDIPHFCWHPALTVAGNCRMCLVEIEKMPKLAIACGTTISDGMVVKTLSEQAIKGREDVMEFLLINHPLDCPICDEAGQCKLQDYEFEHSRGESRFDEQKNHKEKRVPFGPNVLFDGERCISCSRCIRFGTEIAEQPVLGFVDRGDHVSIEANPAEGWDNNLSMNVIDICPVGALTSRDFRFKARVWDMSFTESVCPGCSRGCNIRVGVRNNEILRLEPRTNPNVNEYWMCDYGRLNAYPPVNDERISGPQMKNASGALASVTWAQAVAQIATKLKQYRPEEVLFIGSARATIEDNYLFLKLAQSKFGKKLIPFIPHIEDEDERMLLRADKTPNSMGAMLIGMAPDGHYGHAKGEKHAFETIAEILHGKIKAVYALEDNFLEHSALSEAVKKVEFFACHATNLNTTTMRADVVLPAAQWAEREGVFVNFKGWAQQLHPAVSTQYYARGMDLMNMSRLDRFGTPYDKWARSKKRDARESWRLVQMIANELGFHWKYHETEDVFDEIAGSIAAFGGMSYDSLGSLGQPIVGNAQDVLIPIYREVYQASTDAVESVASVIL